MADRECNKDYTVRVEEGNKVCELKAGDMVWFHIIAMHWDEQYFEESAAFKPERFSEENKHFIKPYTYIPFGIGHRNCIGNRYALMQAKAMLFYLLRDYEVVRSEKTVSNGRHAWHATGVKERLLDEASQEESTVKLLFLMKSKTEKTENCL